MDDVTPTDKFPHVLILPPPPTAVGRSETAACTMDLRTRETSPAVVGSAAYMHASCLHSAGGWLLMVSASSGNKPYLTEPRTGRRVDLPAVPLRQHTAVFSVAGGSPDVVAFFDRDSRHPHVLVSRISDDGAGDWASYMYPNTRECGAFKYGAVVGDEVWYVDAMGKAVALDLRGGVGHCWRVLWADGWGRRNVGRGRQFFLVADSEPDGSSTVIRIHCPPPCYGEFRFSRLDERGGEWVPLTEEELQGTSWFLFGQRCFVARGVDEGKKVYVLSLDDEKREGVGGPTRVLRPIPAVRHGNVYVHDLDAVTSAPLLPEPYGMTAQFWVHPDYF